MFIGRRKELNELSEKLNNDKFESILLYGRRRIGKTELIKEVAKNFDGIYIYYECKHSLLGDNIEAFNTTLRMVFNINFTFQTIKDALKYVFEYAKNHRVLLVIDEFPYLWDKLPIIVSDIRDLIDEYKTTTTMKLILSGSYVDVMKSLNDGHSETYGRFTSIIALTAFDYYDASQFYPNYSDEDKVLMYSVFGGVAFFNSLIDNTKSAVDNIKRLLIEPNSILQLEIEYTIAGETSKIPAVNSVVELIGRGVKKYTDIVNDLTSKNEDKISPDYLIKKLIDLEIIEKVVPINEKSNKKKTLYRFCDNLMEFYYRYIYRHKNMNAILSADDFYLEIVEEDLKKYYLPKKFESISKEFLIRANKEHKINPLIYEIGTYSFNDAKKKINRQFDVVTLDKIGYISYECKYIDKPISASVINEEEYQCKTSGLTFYKLGFISKKGFTDEVDKKIYNLFCLSDFYKF